MTYQKHIWKKGEKITSELLNNIENGIEEVKKDIEKLYQKLENIDLITSAGKTQEVKPKTKKAE